MEQPKAGVEVLQENVRCYNSGKNGHFKKESNGPNKERAYVAEK